MQLKLSLVLVVALSQVPAFAQSCSGGGYDVYSQPMSVGASYGQSIFTSPTMSSIPMPLLISSSVQWGSQPFVETSYFGTSNMGSPMQLAPTMNYSIPYSESAPLMSSPVSYSSSAIPFMTSSVNGSFMSPAVTSPTPSSPASYSSPAMPTLSQQVSPMAVPMSAPVGNCANGQCQGPGTAVPFDFGF